MAGQAATLVLTEAGPRVAYQHLLPPARWGEHPVAAAVLALEALLVLVGLWRTRVRWGGALRSRLTAAPRRWAGAVVASGVLLLLAAFPSREPGAYLIELLVAACLVLVHAGALVLLVLAVPADRLASWTGRVAAAWGGDFPGRPRLDRYALVLALATTVAAAALSVTVYERFPHVPDEVSYLYHAKYLAAGELDMPAPPVPGAFDVDLMMFEGDRWFSPVPIGWSAILAVGVAVGAPWLVNPVLAGVGILLAYLLFGAMYGRTAARAGSTLLAASPWYLFLAMSFMNHTASLVAALAAGWAVSRWRGGGGWGWPLLAGAALGVVGLIRPLEAVIVGLVVLIAMLAGQRPARAIPGLAALGVSAAAVSALVLPYNAHLTGSATRFPIMMYNDVLYGSNSNAMGFGPDRGLGWTGLDPFPGHGPADVVVNTVLNGVAVNVELFGWATGSLLAVLLLSWFRRAWSPADRLMVVAAAIVVGLHAFYWFAGGPDFGARYWFMIIVPLVALTARAVTGLPDEARSRASLAVCALTAAAVLTFIPWRSVDKYDGYRGMRAEVRRLATQEGFDGALVLVRGERHPDYAAAAAENPVDLDSGAAIYAWDRSAEVRRAVRAAFPERPVFVLEGPSVTGDGFRVAERPADGGGR